MQSDHLAWRHTCLAIDFIEVLFGGKISQIQKKLILSQGDIKLYENGRKYFESKSVEDIKKTYKTIAKKMDLLSVG